jgi:hypothetical protein
MDATANFSLRFAPASESKVERSDWLLNRRVLQRIATRMSLLSEAIGFSIFGILIVLNRNQADLNGLGGGGAVAMIGGISAVLVAAVFLVAACLHWSFCIRHPVALPVRRQAFCFTFAKPNPVTASALLLSA